LALLDKTNIYVLYTLGVHPICNQFWEYPLCNVYRHWQPDELHPLLLGLVKDLLHGLFKYLKSRDVNDQFDTRFSSVPSYPGLQRFSKPFDLLKSSYWQGNGMQGVIRILGVNCSPFLECFGYDANTAAEPGSDEMVMRAVWSLCEFSQLVSQQNHSDLSLTALEDSLK